MVCSKIEMTAHQRLESRTPNPGVRVHTVLLENFQGGRHHPRCHVADLTNQLQALHADPVVSVAHGIPSELQDLLQKCGLRKQNYVPILIREQL